MIPGDPIVFDAVRIDGGENYNPATGIYTVPVNGFYEFYINMYVYSDESLNWAFYIAIDGAAITDSAHGVNDASEDYISMKASVIINLTQGQQVSVAPHVEVTLWSSSGAMNSYFSGHLIMAT